MCIRDRTNTKTTIISSSTATAENDISACVQAYEQNIGPIARAAFDDISRQLADLPADLICEAIGEAALNNKPVSYTHLPADAQEVPSAEPEAPAPTAEAEPEAVDISKL